MIIIATDIILEYNTSRFLMGLNFFRYNGFTSQASKTGLT